MISFENFKKAIEAIQRHGEWQERFTDFLEKEICPDSYAMVEVDGNLVQAIIDILCEQFRDEPDGVAGDTISWWLWEDVEKIIYYPDGTQRDITKIEDLYQYLLDEYENKKDMPIKEKSEIETEKPDLWDLVLNAKKPE